MTTTEVDPRPAHRPLGSGSRQIRVLHPLVWPESGARQAGRIFIGRRLWQDLDSFKRTDVLLRSNGDVVIAPRATGSYAVSTGADGQPRLSVGRSLLERLALRSGSYETTVSGTTIVLGSLQQQEDANYSAPEARLD